METANNQTTENPQQNTQLEGGTYEIIQGRLQKSGANLRQRLQQLNETRKNVFGSVETTLIANDRINTENNCIAADIVAFDNYCIFGYNVYLGLKMEMQLSDVFSIYQFSDHSFHQTDLQLLYDERFQEDFSNLYKYYRNTTFLQFAILNAHLYMVFQTGKTAQDIKAFKWAIKNDKLYYVDDRSAHEFRLPKQFEFEWIRTRREMQRVGKHPHISIQDRLFVETVGGDLTIKIEDNTDSGKGIFSEKVEYSEQTLDDAEIYYADLGNLIALKIRPYREQFRYFVYNSKMQTVKRVDTLEDSAVLLPDSHGLIFSDGYYLQTGEFKQFDKQIRGMYFERRIFSPNGEDTLYAFYHPELKEYILMSYNLIEQKVATPILCNGYTCFDTGELCYFRAENEPTKHHVIQIWQTPFTKDQISATADTDNFLYKVGNKDIVKAMAECNEVLTLLNKEDSYANLYLDLVKKTTDVLDSYYWITREEAEGIDEPLKAIKAAAGSAIDEFEKVQRIKENTRKAVTEVSEKADALFTRTKRSRFDSVNVYVQALADFRALRGETISLKELRYIDLNWVTELEERIALQTDRLSDACVRFLLRDDALAPYQKKVSEQRTVIEKVAKVADAKSLETDLDNIGSELELLIDIVSNLKIEDATQTTQIIDHISEIFVQLNQLKAQLKNKRKELLSVEAVAEFNAQFKLLDQSIINYLDLCDTPNKCDEYLTKLMVSLEELEGKFVDFEEFTLQITEKRDEVYNAFEAKKLQLSERRNRRATALQSAAERIFKGVRNRVKGFKEVNEINAYFAADLMVDKVRDIIQQLTDLEDSVKADDVQSQLKSLKEEAIRQLKDRKELFVAGENVIKFGKHHFSVNVQPLDLTIVRRNADMFFHLTGTNFFEKIDDPEFLATKDIWEQELISENRDIYRAEYLAYLVFNELQKNN